MFVTIRLINKGIADINNILIFVTKLSSDLTDIFTLWWKGRQ